MVKQETRGTHFLNQAGVFAGTLLATAMAVYFYSPVIGTHADEAKVTVVNEPVISLALSTNNLAFTINPSIEGTFSSDWMWALTDTNSTGGYELYFSSNDNATDMVSTSQNNSSVVASDFDGTVNASTMGVNKWGYSLDNTNFLKIPTLANQVRIVDINHLPTPYELEKEVFFGIKVSNTLPAGTYAKVVKFSAIAHETLNDLFTIWDMQDMTSTICANTTTPYATATEFDWDGSHRGDRNYVPRIDLRDARDGKTYLVSKLADGNCWMSQSLALDLTSGTAIVASTTAGGTISVTPNNTTQTTTGTTWAEADNNWRSYKPQSNEAYYQSGTTRSSSPSGSGVTYDWEKAGNYYNWYAATAGTGTSSMTSSDATASICPKGWRLPSNTGTKSYYNLITTTYGLASSSAGSLALRAAPLNFNLSGRYNYIDGAMDSRGSYGYYLSSTAESAMNAYGLLFGKSYIYQSSSGKGHGFSVRCVAI